MTASTSTDSTAGSQVQGLLPKAQSVTQEGEIDGFCPARVFMPQVLDGGYTRLLISCPAESLAALHLDLVGALQAPLKVLYIQLTDRERGQLEKPLQLAGIDLESDTVLAALTQLKTLIYHDGRHQLWIRGAGGAQVVLEEIGVIYAYPDDPSFRDLCAQHQLTEAPSAGAPGSEALQTALQTMADRDYVRVNFLAQADAEEARLIWTLGLREWAG